MGSFLLSLLLRVLTSEATKTLIGIGVNKLLQHSKDGITNDLAKTLIDGVAKSKANPTNEDVFKDAIKLLDK